MAIADELSDAGFAIAGPFPTCAAASHWLGNNTPDFAILDMELQDGPCVHVAHELQKREVEFAVFSGSKRHEASSILAPACVVELRIKEALNRYPLSGTP